MAKTLSIVSPAHGIVEIIEIISSNVVIVEMTVGTGHTHAKTADKFAVQRVISTSQIWILDYVREFQAVLLLLSVLLVSQPIVVQMRQLTLSNALPPRNVVLGGRGIDQCARVFLE